MPNFSKLQDIAIIVFSKIKGLGLHLSIKNGLVLTKKLGYTILDLEGMNMRDVTNT